MLASKLTTKTLGEEGEDRALRHLLAQGLVLVERNYRVAKGPSARGAEIDLIMRDHDGTLVFVEVRQRKSTTQGGAAASVGRTKQQRCIRGAKHYLLGLPDPRAWPPCRFDVVAIDGDALNWIVAAFDAGGH